MSAAQAKARKILDHNSATIREVITSYDSGLALIGRDQPALDVPPSGRTSLLDMMNFSYFRFAIAVRMVAEDLADEEHALAQQDAPPLNETRRKIVKNHVENLGRNCGELNLERAASRLRRIIPLLDHGCSRSEVVQEIKTLLQAAQDDVQLEYFFHYRRDKAITLMGCIRDWGPTIKAFPSLGDEIEEGVDCYAMEHNTACVFHMMRVAELGMRALARERKVTFPHRPLEWAERENVIDQIDAKAKAATTGMSRGAARDAARAFYTAAVAQLRAFKETRNRIMHMRGSFDELDAHRAMTQVREFMNGLSAKIGEKTRRPIPLSRWP